MSDETTAETSAESTGKSWPSPGARLRALLAGPGPRASSSLPAHGSEVLSRDGEVAGTVAGYRRCMLAGCTGTQVRVVWPDGRWTWPCTKGLVPLDPHTCKVG